MAVNLAKLGEHIAAKLGASVTGMKLAYGELTIGAMAGDIVSVLTFLRGDAQCGFSCFIDICGADYPERAKRFDVVYHLLAPYKNQRIRVKIEADEIPRCRASSMCSPPPTGSSAKLSISTACCSRVIPTCAQSPVPRPR